MYRLFINKKIMKLPKTNDKSEVLVVRLDKATKKRLQEIANKNGKNSSDVVRTLIDSAYTKRF
jgi:predicted DNA-binding protein